MICGGDSFASFCFLQSTIPSLGDDIQGFGPRRYHCPARAGVTIKMCNATRGGTAGIISGAVEVESEIRDFRDFRGRIF